MKTEWNLQLLYQSIDDPQIEKDLKSIERACTLFAKRYRSKTKHLSNESSLLAALKEYDVLHEQASGARPLVYFFYCHELKSADALIEAKMNTTVARLSKVQNTITFFELDLGAIPTARRSRLLTSKKLLPYRYFLKQVFEKSKHHLSEEVESALNLSTLPSHGMWIQAQEKYLNSQTIFWEGKQLPLSEAQDKVQGMPTEKRRALSDEIFTVLRSVSSFAEAEINAVYTNKKIQDELRGFKEPYSATLLEYQNKEKEIMSMVQAVTDAFPLSHRFYRLKAKMLNLPHLEYADRAAGVGSVEKKYPWEESVELIRRAFSGAHEKYSNILDNYLGNGQIDVFPRLNKSSGAFCAGSTGNPTFVLLNHTGEIRSVTTLAHEMGHAFHTELSKTQSPMYQHYPYSTAEVASTFFENFVFDELLSKATDKEKIVLLHSKLNDEVATIFRQIAFFNFELELHRSIRERGFVPKEEIAALLNTHSRAYLGPLFKLKENEGYFFLVVSHFRRFFYVYSYAYGSLISRALYKRYKEDKSFLSSVEKFLSAGGSKAPAEIFKDIGIDTTHPEFFKEGLKSVEDDILRLEKLLN